jgi:sigma-B regulation protein RsbU (phosphoserine phosphatase)
MLELKDFYHLPLLASLFEQIAGDGPGLILVAGLDPRPLSVSTEADGLLPSGRSTILRILMRQIMLAHPTMQAAVVAESREAVRVPRNLRRRVRFAHARPAHLYSGCIAEAIRRHAGLLVVDCLARENATASANAAAVGLCVLSQIDTVFRGADVERALRELGVPDRQLHALTWVVAVQRLATLCPHCSRPDVPSTEQLELLRHRFPHLAERDAPEFTRADGCLRCHGSGRLGDVATFDVYRAGKDGVGSASRLSLEAYVLQLAMAGLLSLPDVLRMEADQLHRTYTLLNASERALGEANAALERKLAELEAANRVLQQRTEALISLQDLGQALIAAADLRELSFRVCRHICALCGADRAVLFFLRSDDVAEALAVRGWKKEEVAAQVPAAEICGLYVCSDPGPHAFDRLPPGASGEQGDIRAGLAVPLVAQGSLVGAIIVHSTSNDVFLPGETALLQTYAYQAALAIQRAGLVDSLRDHIAQLQEAQEELVKKERMERELELARQVQQSVLPRIFPLVPGYTFAARSEPARQVGGDLYDVVLLDAHHVGLVIADVSDKGMPAALYMALTRSLLLAEAQRERSPHAILRNVHRLLLALGEPDMFVTIFYGIIEVPTRRLTYARAGHDRPLLVRAGTVQQLEGHGTFIGFAALGEVSFSEEELTLAPGDRLVLYTDGLTDAVGPDRRPFDLERFVSSIQSCADLTPDELCKAVFAEVASYQGAAEQFDDMTMLVVEVR